MVILTISERKVKMTAQSTLKDRSGLQAWMILACAGTFYFYQWIIRASPNVMNQDIIEALSINAGTFGTVMGAYYWGYAPILIPLGLIMDRVGPRWLLTLAGFTCSLGCWLFSTASTVEIAWFARFLMGMGSSCGFLGCLKLGTLWFQPKHMGKVIGITLMMGTSGAMIGGAPLEFLNSLVGWRTTLQLLAFMGIIVSLLIILVVRNTPQGYAEEQAPDEHIFQGLWRTICTPQAWILALFGLLMYLPITLLGVAWGVPFVQKLYGIDDTLAASVVGAMWFGGATGAPFFAALSDHWLRRRAPMILCAFCAILVHVTTFWISGVPLSLMYVLFYFIGFFYTGKTLTFASICEIMPPSASGVAVGFTNTFVMFAGVIAHPLVGWLLDYHWGGSMIDGVPLYTLADYRFALSILPISMIASLVLIQFVRETHPASRRRLA